MGKILVIGSAVADVIIKLEDHLPVKGEDVHVLSQEMRLGGCAFNVFHMVRHFGQEAIPFFPIGTGPYADFVAQAFRERGVVSAIPRPEKPNGCCYCFIEADGERTFVVYHGAEYRFEKAWFDALDPGQIDMCYICGLEIEETTGPVIADFLEAHPHIRVFFAPGPRILKIDPLLLGRILALHPILHLNEEEALAGAGICRALQSGDGRPLSAGQPGPSEALRDAAAQIHSVTAAPVIITLGEKGAVCWDGTRYLEAAPYPARQIDTIGAGDAHAGACLALLHSGASLDAALDRANQVASRVVSVPGALLEEDVFAAL